MSAHGADGLRDYERELLGRDDPDLCATLEKLARVRLACDRVADKTRAELLAATVDRGALVEAHEELCEGFAILLKSRERLLRRVEDLEASQSTPLFNEMERLAEQRDEAMQNARDAFARGRRSAANGRAAA